MTNVIVTVFGIRRRDPYTVGAAILVGTGLILTVVPKL